MSFLEIGFLSLTGLLCCVCLFREGGYCVSFFLQFLCMCVWGRGVVGRMGGEGEGWMQGRGCYFSHSYVNYLIYGNKEAGLQDVKILASCFPLAFLLKLNAMF